MASSGLGQQEAFWSSQPLPEAAGFPLPAGPIGESNWGCSWGGATWWGPRATCSW